MIFIAKTRNLLPFQGYTSEHIVFLQKNVIALCFFSKNYFKQFYYEFFLFFVLVVCIYSLYGVPAHIGTIPINKTEIWGYFLPPMLSNVYLVLHPTQQNGILETLLRRTQYSSAGGALFTRLSLFRNNSGVEFFQQNFLTKI